LQSDFRSAGGKWVKWMTISRNPVYLPALIERLLDPFTSTARQAAALMRSTACAAAIPARRPQDGISI
jgi:hypothetical protein